MDKLPRALRKFAGLDDGETESSEGTITNSNDADDEDNDDGGGGGDNVANFFRSFKVNLNARLLNGRGFQ